MTEPTDVLLITVLEVLLLETYPLLYTVSTFYSCIAGRCLSVLNYLFFQKHPMGSLGNQMGGELFSLILPGCLGSRYGKAVFLCEVETQ